MRSIERRINLVVNLLILTILIGWVILPNGPVGQHIWNWFDDRKTANTIEDLWPELVDAESRLGSNDADLIIVEFSDYQCPFCRHSDAEVLKMLEDDTRIGVVYRHLPLTTIHPYAEWAARVSICAEEQGQFQAIHKILMQDSSWISEPSLERIDTMAGEIDTASLQSCLNSDVPDSRIASDRELAAKLGLRSTPSWVTMAGITIGTVDAEQFRELVLEDRETR